LTNGESQLKPNPEKVRQFGAGLFDCSDKAIGIEANRRRKLSEWPNTQAGKALGKQKRLGRRGKREKKNLTSCEGIEGRKSRTQGNAIAQPS
jgi:hypothetical protein